MTGNGSELEVHCIRPIDCDKLATAKSPPSRYVIRSMASRSEETKLKFKELKPKRKNDEIWTCGVIIHPNHAGHLQLPLRMHLLRCERECRFKASSRIFLFHLAARPLISRNHVSNWWHLNVFIFMDHVICFFICISLCLH